MFGPISTSRLVRRGLPVAVAESAVTLRTLLETIAAAAAAVLAYETRAEAWRRGAPQEPALRKVWARLRELRAVLRNAATPTSRGRDDVDLSIATEAAELLFREVAAEAPLHTVAPTAAEAVYAWENDAEALRYARAALADDFHDAENPATIKQMYDL